MKHVSMATQIIGTLHSTTIQEESQVDEDEYDSDNFDEMYELDGESKQKKKKKSKKNLSK